MLFRVTSKSDECCSTHLIDGDGNFNGDGLENFIKEVKLAECGLSYAVVSIMGPQSSGKSTLLNHLFRTNFREMDAFKGRSQTTQGIWLARCFGIEPCTLVMDLEGTDGGERGQDDTKFEKQSALFALAVSDIVLINMWCHDIGRDHAANRPLLKIVFQVMMQLFTPRKTTLMFVIRDKTMSPLEILEPILRKDIQKIWDSVPKPHAHKETPLSEFFNVEVVALSSYEENEGQFTKQVADLRQRFIHSIAPGGLAGDRRTVVPASGFSFSAQHIWKIIKENKDLDLPALKVLVATVRCEEIANKMGVSFQENKEWRQLEQDVQSHIVPGFGRKLSSILDVYLSEYDEEATLFDESVKTSKRKQLEDKLLQFVQHSYHKLLGHIRSGALKRFKTVFEDALRAGKAFSVAGRDGTELIMSQFDRECADAVIVQANWDFAKVRDKLRRDIDANIAEVRTAKLAELSGFYEAKLNHALSGPVNALMNEANEYTWPSIRRLFRDEMDRAIIEFSDALSGFEMENVGKEKMVSKLEEYARGVVEGKAKEAAGGVLIYMKDRFLRVFSYDADSMQRVWTRQEDIQVIAKTARSASLKLLSVMAAIRLHDEETDNIEKTLSLALLVEDTSSNSSTSTNKDPLAISSWDEIPPERTLISPVRCKSLWYQFITETEYAITQAYATQEANNAPNNPRRHSWRNRLLWASAIQGLVSLAKNLFGN